MTSTLLIIGGGIAGLSAGVYGRMNGYRTQIFEMHSLPGLERFYLAGQWVEIIGGVPSAAFSARNAIKLICSRDGRMFNADVE